MSLIEGNLNKHKKEGLKLMIEENEELKIIDNELYNYYGYIKQLDKINNCLLEIEAQLISLSSPKIKSIEEAKYQAGTKVYSDLKLLEQLEKKEYLLSQRKELLFLIKRMQSRLNKLSNEELKLIEKRYKYKKTLRQLGTENYKNKDTIYIKIKKILQKIAQ